MKFFEDLKKKKKLKDENYLKEYYGKMSIETASDLFNQRVDKTYLNGCSEDNPPMVFIKRDFDFQFGNWLKYSPNAPKGIGMISETFFLQAIARFGFDVKENPYLGIDYTNILNPFPYDHINFLWWCIDEGKIRPFTRDKWLFDPSLYSEDAESNRKKVYSIMLCYDKKFRSDYGIAERKEYESLFKRNGKFLTYKAIESILNGLTTSSPEEEI